MDVGIEAINVYMGRAALDLNDLSVARGLDASRFVSLMMEKKSVSIPCEDAVTNAVNAAKPIIDALSDEEKNSIQLLIVATESGIDFGKAMSTYVHHYLNLNKRCCLFEIKQACYGGTAALQMAVNTVAASGNPTIKALVIATDEARPSARMTYAEPSQGTSAVAMLVSAKANVLLIDRGASGYYSYEVMDTCRPTPEEESGDPDLSLISYLDCLEGAFSHYCDVVEDIEILSSFDYMLFHAPFGGMVKGAHRKLVRKETSLDRNLIEEDFNRRVLPSLDYAMQVGNTYSASIFMALCSLLDNITLPQAARVSLFSYGSGCSSEFYSGVILTQGQDQIKKLGLKQKLNERVLLSMEQYDDLSDLKKETSFGVKDISVNYDAFMSVYRDCYEGQNLLALTKIENYHRVYHWS